MVCICDVEGGGWDGEVGLGFVFYVFLYVSLVGGERRDEGIFAGWSEKDGFVCYECLFFVCCGLDLVWESMMLLY